MDYIKEYEKWLASCALNQSELAEIKSISDNEELKEFRFGSLMSFGTAGLRSTM